MDVVAIGCGIAVPVSPGFHRFVGVIGIAFLPAARIGFCQEKARCIIGVGGFVPFSVDLGQHAAVQIIGISGGLSLGISYRTQAVEDVIGIGGFISVAVCCCCDISCIVIGLGGHIAFRVSRAEEAVVPVVGKCGYIAQCVISLYLYMVVVIFVLFQDGAVWIRLFNQAVERIVGIGVGVAQPVGGSSVQDFLFTIYNFLQQALAYIKQAVGYTY